MKDVCRKLWNQIAGIFKIILEIAAEIRPCNTRKWFNKIKLFYQLHSSNLQNWPLKYFPITYFSQSNFLNKLISIIKRKWNYHFPVPHPLFKNKFSMFRLLKKLFTWIFNWKIGHFGWIKNKLNRFLLFHDFLISRMTSDGGKIRHQCGMTKNKLFNINWLLNGGTRTNSEGEIKNT